jgi:hypothetical protein
MRAGAPRIRAEKGTIGASSLCAALFEHAIRSLTHAKAISMNSIIYIVGLIVVVLFILSFFGLR